MPGMQDLKQFLCSMARNAVWLSIAGGDGPEVGHFGGLPDVPSDFVWPYFETDTFDDDTVKPRPLSFLAQFDCTALAELDRDGLLPREGVLSLFYEMGSQRGGFDPQDAGCARVYWFPEGAALHPAPFPEDLPDFGRLSRFPIRGASEADYPAYQDAESAMPDKDFPEKASMFDQYDEVVAALRKEERNGALHKLLGWPNIIQNNMTQECELVSRGHYCGSTWNRIPAEGRREAEQTSLEKWLLLFQLDSFTQGEFSLDFGDCGSIYFYIRTEDLAARRFDRVWLIMQCY